MPLDLSPAIKLIVMVMVYSLAEKAPRSYPLHAGSYQYLPLQIADRPPIPIVYAIPIRDSEDEAEAASHFVWACRRSFYMLFQQITLLGFSNVIQFSIPL